MRGQILKVHAYYQRTLLIDCKNQVSPFWGGWGQAVCIGKIRGLAVMLGSIWTEQLSRQESHLITLHDLLVRCLCSAPKHPLVILRVPHLQQEPGSGKKCWEVPIEKLGTTRQPWETRCAPPTQYVLTLDMETTFSMWRNHKHSEGEIYFTLK